MGRTDEAWYTELSGETPDAALADLRELLLRGLRFSLTRYRVTDADLEDFVQEGLLKILDNLSSYRREARFTTWAQKICVRVALTELRRRRWRDVSLEDLMPDDDMPDFTPAVFTDPKPAPDEVTTTQMMTTTLHNLIEEELTELQRKAMMATLQGEMPLQEVAARLGTNRNALYKLLHDGRKRLKSRMLREGFAPHELLTMFAK